jgi:uncharacterized protein (DUF2164 family)
VETQVILFLLFLSAFIGTYFMTQTILQFAVAVVAKRAFSLTFNLFMAALGIAGTVTATVYAFKVGV